MSRLIDLTGLNFNGIIVKGRAGRDSTNKTTWNCVCHCGIVFQTTGLNLKSGNTKSCGCRKHVEKRFDLTAKKFFRLTVVSLEKVLDGKVFWRCICDCGKETVVSYGHLSNGHTKSCGCFMSEISSYNAKINLGRKGENHPRWRFDRTEADRARVRLGQSEWAKLIFKRDSFLCIKCGNGGKLCAHHLISFAREPERRYDMSNGVTLCQQCHYDFHRKYGTVKFTRSDFFEWTGKPDPGDFSIIGELTGFTKEIADFISSESIDDLKTALRYLDDEIKRREAGKPSSG